MSEAGRTAELLGLPLFKTDLFLPRYRTGELGAWRIVTCGLHVERGWHTGAWAVAEMPVLLRRAGAGWETWMSLSPCEIESQELACRHACGHTAVMGLGLGWVAANIALNPAVARVTVVERDPEVIELVARAGGLDELPAAAARKLTIVQADALDWRPAAAVDFLHVDIWRAPAAPEALPDVRRIAAQVRAPLAYFWGQELVLQAAASRLAPGPAAEPPHARLARAAAEVLGLPLLVPADRDYAALVERVARARGLP
jgi:hypothetical protein